MSAVQCKETSQCWVRGRAPVGSQSHRRSRPVPFLGEGLCAVVEVLSPSLSAFLVFQIMWRKSDRSPL